MSPAPLPTVLLLDTDARRPGGSAEALSREAGCPGAHPAGGPRHKWNKSRAAAGPGLSRVLRARLDRYGVAPSETTRELEEG